ncbi:MAG: 3-hydroxyacyl-CoA dehydrogenase NAD-binding domain-containing protein [Planctomycetes bacterium]|nr:3-hydroxyacyl-CoA dehydrogenase NAD-binding domain-containing protein [Planctomycetota bacterium]
MNNIPGLPFPPNSPDPGACIRLEHPEEGLAVLVLDPPHRSLAVLDAPLIRDLSAAIKDIENDPSLKALVITGRAPGQFAAGADIDAIGSLTDPEQVEAMVMEVHHLFNRIEDLKLCTVAAVSGPVPGGAYEISLACDFIVASDDEKTRIGLPETQLGILPGWGGSHRLPKRIGVPLALDAILSGRLFLARAAWKRGMIDRLTKPEYLVSVATEIAMKRLPCKRKNRGWKSWAIDRNPLATRVIASLTRKQVLKKTKGHYPAPLVALDLVIKAVGTSRLKGAQKEAKAIATLGTGPICKALVSLFHGSEAAKKLARLPDGVKSSPLASAGVIGSGVMGGGIASALADKGISTRLADLDPQALDSAQVAHRADINKKLMRRRLKEHRALQAQDALSVTTDASTLGTSEIVIEAIAEVLEVKRKVLGSLAEHVSEECILATNTSSLSVSEIAQGIPHPERVVGMHFFNPVKKMPLVEIVRGEQTSEEVVAKTAALAVKLGKTPVVVADVAGFLVNRLLGPYLDEAQRLFVGGADPQKMDRLLVQFGMPMGPFSLLDEVGLDIAVHAGQSLHQAYGIRMQPCEDLASGLGEHRLGKKSGLGFYKHSKARGASPEIAPDLHQFQTSDWARDYSDQTLVDHMVLSIINEAARCLEENVVKTGAMLDLATVFGTGFAPFHGGVLAYADHLGADEVVRRLETIKASEEVQRRPGGIEKFTPAPILKTKAQGGGTLRD